MMNAKILLLDLLIIKNIVLMNAADLQQISAQWKDTMKKERLKVDLLDTVLNVRLS